MAHVDAFLFHFPPLNQNGTMHPPQSKTKQTPEKAIKKGVLKETQQIYHVMFNQLYI